MSSKSWRLVVTELGASAPTSEARVEAGNWMTALTLAREAIGESGGVPPGASCSVAPDGRVTIQDAVARKTYSLVPESLSEAPAPRGPRAPSDPAPHPSATLRVPKPSQPPPARPSVARSTIAYDAAKLGIGAKPAERAGAEQTPPEAAAGTASEGPANRKSEPPANRKAKRTIAYDAAELGLNQPAKSQPSKSEPPANRKAQRTIAYDATELGLNQPAKSQPSKSEPPANRKAQRTIAYDAAELGLNQPAKSQPSKSEPPANRKAKRTIAYDAAELGLNQPAKSQPSKSEPPANRKAQRTIAYDAAELGLNQATQSQPPKSEPPAAAVPSWDLLHSRDEDPSKDSPLLYRERTYVVLQQTNEALAEAFLRERFRELERELAARPKGKLVNMALFDHRWTDRPAKPPLVTLQWKDWRGAPVVTSPASSGAAEPAPSTPPSAAESTAQASALADEPTAPAPPSGTPTESQAPTRASAPPPSADPQPARAEEPGVAPSADPLDLDIVEPAPSRRAQGDRLAAAFEALQDLFFLTTPVEGLDFVVRLLEDLIPSEAISACLYDINTDEFRFVVLTGPGADERRGEAVPRAVGLFGAAVMTAGETLLVEVTGRDERYDPGIDGRVGIDPETMALAAVSHGGRLLGLLQLINRQHQAQFSRADANLITYVAAKLGEFLHAARTRAD